MGLGGFGWDLESFASHQESKKRGKKVYMGGFGCFGCFRDGFGCQRIIRHPPKFEITVRGWVRGRRILREPPEILITIFRWVEWV